MVGIEPKAYVMHYLKLKTFNQYLFYMLFYLDLVNISGKKLLIAQL